ncbi:uncharacterized protein LOC144632258 isoform X1 [Oculina patagonica]
MVLHVTLLAEEWTQSAKGGTHSILNRQLAIHLAQLPNVKVGLLIPKCSPEDKQDAEQYQINIVEPEECPGLDPVYLLGHPPEGFSTDFIIGHDIKLGWQGKVIRQKCGCKWIHVVHSNTEEMGLYKNFAGAISAGQEEHETQVKLCESADMVVTIGPKLKDSFSSSLSMLGKEVVNLTPGIFDEFCNIRHKFQDTKTCKILIFGTGDAEDFELKGLDVAAKAVAALDDPKYRLMVVGAPDGRQEELANKLCSHGISREQLIVRRFYKDRKQLAHFFCEVDLLLMPSGTEAFGIAALEALSEGVPLLLTSNSGLADALREVPLGPQCIVDPNANWAKEIKKAWNNLKTRQEEAKILCERYKEKYSWKEQCAALVEKMQSMHDPAASLGISVEFVKAKLKGASSQNGTSDSANSTGTKERTEGAETTATSQSTERCIPTKEEIFRIITWKKIQTMPDHASSEDHEDLLTYLTKIRGVLFQDFKVGSLLITVMCRSLRVLEELWYDYTSGHLNEVVQKCLVTEDILNDLGLSELKLDTIIREDDYKACKQIFQESGPCETAAPEGKPVHLTDEKTSTKTEDKKPKAAAGKDDSALDKEGPHETAVPEVKPVHLTDEKTSTETEDKKPKAAAGKDDSALHEEGRGLVQSHSPGSVVPTINQTTIDVNAGKGETHSTENQDWKLLHSAVRGGNVAIIETVLARGLDIESKNSYGSTPLMVAALNCKMEVVNYLLDKGADPSLTGEYGKNLLHFASQGGNVAIIETMLSRGLDVNSKDSCGNTPTMFAASSGKIEAVNYLLDRGADLSLTSKNGKNLLHMASFGGNVAIIETMLSHGLNVNSKDNRGDTPSTIAADNGDAEAVNYLLSRGAR